MCRVTLTKISQDSLGFEYFSSHKAGIEAMHGVVFLAQDKIYIKCYQLIITRVLIKFYDE